MKNVPYDIQTIIELANHIASTGKSYGSTGEVIAAAFVMDRMDWLPEGYTVIEAWERLDSRWQGYVKIIKAEYSDLLVPW